jgi:glycerol uptake facilitator protein
MATVSTATAFGVEVVLTAVLMVVILALGNPRNTSTPAGNLTPAFVGLCVTAVVGIGAPLTMAAINPARDFGPRLFGYVAGFGSIAIPGPRGHEWWLFIVAPITGALLGSVGHQAVTNVREPEGAGRARA